MCPNPRNRNKLFVRCNIILRVRARRSISISLSLSLHRISQTHVQHPVVLSRDLVLTLHRSASLAICPHPLPYRPFFFIPFPVSSSSMRARTVVDPPLAVVSRRSWTTSSRLTLEPWRARACALERDRGALNTYVDRSRRARARAMRDRVE